MDFLYANINEFDIDFLKEKASRDRLNKALKFRFEADIKRSLLAGILLEQALLDRNVIISEPIQYHIDEYSKPHLFDEYGKEIFFSLSHSGDYSVCVIDVAPCGVDIELITDYKFNIAERFFHDREKKEVTNEYEFFKYWTLKEAFMKIVGLGMSLPMNEFYVECEAEANGVHLFDFFYNVENTIVKNKILQITENVNLEKRDDAKNHICNYLRASGIKGKVLDLIGNYSVSICGVDVENLNSENFNIKNIHRCNLS